jgi:hypothetical protein
MSDYITLLGAEAVERAARSISESADQMQRAAETIDHSAERMIRALDETAQRIELSTISKTEAMQSMTLRDYFAAQALPIVEKGSRLLGENFLRCENFDEVARDAYVMADAMLKARES